MATFIKWFLILAVLAGGAGAMVWYYRKSDESTVTYRTGAVSRGEILQVITSTGSVVPEETVDVGAQVAGMIFEFGKDKAGKQIDFTSLVSEGQVLAKIDDAVYQAENKSAEAQVTQAKASVTVAQANVVHAGATVDQSRAAVQSAKANVTVAQSKQGQAENDWKRALKLGTREEFDPKKALRDYKFDEMVAAISASEFDGFRSTLEQANASLLQVRAAEDQAAAGQAQSESALEQSKAAVVQAQANVEQAEASLVRSQRNLAYCTIKSPVDGVIIDRKVNVGQTVVASLNAPSLFLIARDLSRMQVLASVNEADIGSIYSGQKTVFTVDAWPNDTFVGTVEKVRLNASMTQNVVTYTVEILTDNPGGRLLPQMTATVRFEVGHRTDVLRVPLAAIRWQPRNKETIDPAYRQVQSGPATQPAESRGGEGRGGRAGRSGGRAGGGGSAERGPSTRPGAEPMGHGTVWVKSGAFVRPIEVRTGISDGNFTEVSSPELHEGMEIIVGEELPAGSAGPSGGTNPFAPTRGGGRR